MYDEFERAVTGKRKPGLPTFGWVLIALALLVMFGIAGVGVAAYRVVKTVQKEVRRDIGAEVVRELEGLDAEIAAELRGLDKEILAELKGLDAEIAAEVAEALAEVERELARELDPESRALAVDFLSRLSTRLGDLMGDPEAGLALLRDLGSSGHSEEALRQVLEGSLRVRTEDGEVTADLWGGEDGGSLVIDSPEGEVRIDLVREEGGGELVIRTEERVVRLGAGSAAEGLPAWVPAVRGMPADPKPLFSASSAEGALGAVSWETGRAPRAILDFYRRELESAGYEIREEHSAWHRGEVEGGFWAENEEARRVVFLGVSEDDEVTRVILGYGEDGA